MYDDDGDDDDADDDADDGGDDGDDGDDVDYDHDDDDDFDDDDHASCRCGYHTSFSLSLRRAAVEWPLQPGLVRRADLRSAAPSALLMVTMENHHFSRLLN